MSLDVDCEALKVIQNTAVEAAAATVIEIGNDPRRRYVKVGSNPLERVEIRPPTRQHFVETLADLIAYALEAARNEKLAPVVWHGRNVVALILDDHDRRDRALFPLTFSCEFHQLWDLDCPPGVDPSERLIWQNQRVFLDLLQLGLGLDSAAIDQFRRLDWEQRDNTSSTIQHATDRLGKELAAQVTGTDKALLPEDLCFSVPVYRQLGEREARPVRCDVLIDSEAQRLALRPQLGEIDSLLAQAQMDIRGRLEKGLTEDVDDTLVKIPIYYGTP